MVSHFPPLDQAAIGRLSFDSAALLLRETAMDHPSISGVGTGAREEAHWRMEDLQLPGPSLLRSEDIFGRGEEDLAAVSVELNELSTSVSIVANRARFRDPEATISAKTYPASDELPKAIRTSINFRIDRRRVTGYRQRAHEFNARSALTDVPGSQVSDPVVKRLTAALALAEERGAEFDRLYAETVRLAIVTRILSLQNVAEATTTRQAAPLQKWRLKRVLDYVEAHYAETIRLRDLARAAGLSPMHFAAQFRVATGVRPREFIVRYRIRMSQRLLAETRHSVVDIALAVGFQSQSHFTTVFKQRVGQTPWRWRNLHLDSLDASSRNDGHFWPDMQPDDRCPTMETT